ncbi:MAG: response regulator transcription factor [Deinococcales bacterium]
MSPREPIRLFIVDDHAIVRAGVRMLLNAQSALEVVGEAESAEDALEVLPGIDADVVLLDLSLPGMNGIEAVRALRRRLPQARFIALSMHEDPEYVQGFLEAGGSGYVPKSSLEMQLVDAILAVSRGEYYAPARLLAELAREMASGDLGISEKTVATYRERASEKLGVKTRAELVRWALEHNLLE